MLPIHMMAMAILQGYPTVDNMLKNHSGDTTSGWNHSSSVADATFAFVSDDARSLFGEK